MLTKTGTAVSNSGREEGELTGTRDVFMTLGQVEVPQRAGSCYQP